MQVWSYRQNGVARHAKSGSQSGARDVSCPGPTEMMVHALPPLSKRLFQAHFESCVAVFLSRHLCLLRFTVGFWKATVRFGLPLCCSKRRRSVRIST